MIRPWTESDRPTLEPLILAYLAENYSVGGDLRPTEKNADLLFKCGVAANTVGDPTLLLEKDGTVIGFCLWVGMPNRELDLREKSVAALGTYIVPGFRRQGFSKELRREAIKVAKDRGYTRVDGIAYHKIGFEAGVSVGVKAAGLVSRLSLKE